MNGNRLSKRLATVAGNVPQDSVLLDVGSDHAYLPVYLANQNIIQRGIASEVIPGPYHNLVSELKMQDQQHIIEPRFGNGLDVLKSSDDVNVITICGMGGNLITRILDRGRSQLSFQYPKLILQPNVEANVIRTWLMKHHYRLVHEQIVDDHHHIYEILVAEYTKNPVHYNRRQLRFGPFLMKTHSTIFVAKWQEVIQHFQKVIQSIQHATHGVPIKKVQVLKKKIEFIQQVIKK